MSIKKRLSSLFLSAVTSCTLIGVASIAIADSPNKNPCDALFPKDSNIEIPDTVTCSFEQKNRIVRSSIQQPILVLSRIQNIENPMADAMKPENQLGLVEPGTQLKILGETLTKNFMLNYSKVEILKGRLKGKTGWIATGALEY